MNNQASVWRWLDRSFLLALILHNIQNVIFNRDADNYHSAGSPFKLSIWHIGRPRLNRPFSWQHCL